MKIFTSLYNYLCLNKTTIKKIFLFILISYLFTDLSFAAETAKDAVSSGVDTSLTLLNGVLKVFSVILGFLTVISGVFLDPGWTTGSIIGLDTSLKSLWIFISNVVYFVFAMLFIWIAFMNIIGKGGEYELKSALPRFIVGVLIVPFSWFIVQFVISVSGVLTVGVLGLPYDTFKDTVYKDLKTQKFDQCDKDGYLFTTGTDTGSQLSVKCKTGTKAVTFDEILDPNKSTNIFGIMSIYTYSVMKVDNAGKLFGGDVTQGGTIKTVADAILKFGFDLIFVVAYCLLMIALALALFVRGFWLWIFAMFSPALGLLYFMKKGKSGAGTGSMTNFSFEQLIKLALMPVYVAGALSFGLLFIFVAGNGFSGGNTDGVGITNSGTTFTYKKEVITLSGSLNKAESKIKGYDGPIGNLILEIFGLAILWVTLLSAMKSSKITESVVKPFENMGNSIGGLVKNLPSYAPIIPTPGGMVGAKDLDSMAGSFSGAIINNNSSKASQMGIAAARKLGFGDDDLNKLGSIIAEYKGNPSVDKLTETVNQFVGNINSSRLSDSSYREKISSYLGELGAKDELRKEVETNGKNSAELGLILSKYGKSANLDKGWNSNSINAIRKSEIYEKQGTQIQSIIGSGGVNTNQDQTPPPPEFSSTSPFSSINDKNFDNDPKLIIENRKEFITKLTGSQSKITDESFRKDIKDTLINKFRISDTELTEEVLKNKDELIKFLKNNKQWEIQ